MHAIAYAVDDPEEPNIFIAKRVLSALLSPITDKKFRIIIVFLLVTVVVLVALMTWLGLTGIFFREIFPLLSPQQSPPCSGRL